LSHALQKSTKSKPLISAQRHWLNGLVCNHQKFWKKLGDFESKVLEFDIEPIKIDRPVYVCGLARSGSTVLLEFLASHRDFVSHKYSDFPFIFTPYLWRKLQKILMMKPSKPVERFHGDGIKVTSESPEAMEEVLWMHFFKGLHNLDTPERLKDTAALQRFFDFYLPHIKKLLFQSKAPRYLAKGNYNIARIDKIIAAVPDAKFIVPVRSPVSHVESLLRQHENFLTKTKGQKRAVKHLQRVGHFEFGADIRPIYLGQDDVYHSILDLFKSGEMVRGYARYWAYVYDYIYTQYVESPSVLCYRYEDFCDKSHEMLTDIADFSGVSYKPAALDMWAEYIQRPSYYKTNLKARDLKIIADETKQTAALWGYSS
tara:strand:- start:164807 stop:165919 length:1113 start_codon:yes stop_codon:yes gene_type:complete